MGGKEGHVHETHTQKIVMSDGLASAASDRGTGPGRTMKLSDRCRLQRKVQWAATSLWGGQEYITGCLFSKDND
eukprot:scaffold13047_cov32-Tisochrysis_lutea.AAC.3